MNLPKLLHYLQCTLRMLFVILTNLYCIPTYLVWNWIFLLPIRILQHPLYWYIEGMLFKWLLYMVASWSWTSNYFLVEVGEDITPCIDQRCLLLVNHQSTADVPLLMAAFQDKKNVIPTIMWIMDRMFRYTNFGAVSVTHGDYFITQGKNVRDSQLQKLQDHLLNVYLSRGRHWIVLFPEGGFLRKRKAVSQRYARENNYPVLQHVTLPRVGAMYIVLNTLRPGKLEETVQKYNPRLYDKLNPLKWVIDVTIGYPEGNPLDLPTICSASRPSCVTYLYYRRYPIEEIPMQDMDSLKEWVYDRWTEKEAVLKEFYQTGQFPTKPQGLHDANSSSDHPGLYAKPHKVTLNNWWIGFLHLFFISSSLFHCYLFHRLWTFAF